MDSGEPVSFAESENDQTIETLYNEEVNSNEPGSWYEDEFEKAARKARKKERKQKKKEKRRLKENSKLSGSDGENHKEKKKHKKHKKHRRSSTDEEGDEKNKISTEKKSVELPESEDEMKDFIEQDSDQADRDDVIPVEGGINSDDDITDSDHEVLSKTSYIDSILSNLRRKKKKYKVTEHELQEFVSGVLHKMREAAKADELSLKNHKPAFAKLQLLDSCLAEMSKPMFIQWFVQEATCQVLSEWLAPLEDGSLPNVTIRSSLLRLLLKMPITPSDLSNNDLGRRIVFMWQHQDETEENRLMIRALVQQWMRPLLGISSDYRDYQHRQQLEQEHMMEEQSQKPSAQQFPGSHTSRPSSKSDLPDIEIESKGRRAVPPLVSGFNFTIQPRSDFANIDESNRFKTSIIKGKKIGHSKNFKLPRKAQKVSIEGRGLY